MAKTQSARQIRRASVENTIKVFENAGLPIEAAILNSMELLKESAGMAAPSEDQLAALEFIEDKLGRTTKLQAQSLARLGKFAEADQIALNRMDILREQGQLGRRKAKLDAELSRETSAQKAAQASAARQQAAQLEQDARKAAVAFDLRKKAGNEGIRIGNIPKEAKAKAVGEVEAKFAAQALEKTLADANMSPADKALRDMSLRNKEEILARMATTPGLPPEYTAENGELLKKLIPDDGIRSEVTTMVAARQARAATEAEQQIAASGIKDDAVKSTLRSKAATTGMRLSADDLAKGNEVQAIRMEVLNKAQEQGLRLSGDLTPQSGKGILGMLTKSGVAEATPIMSEASAAIAALEPQRARQAATQGLRVLAGGPMRSLLKGGLGLGGIGLLMAMLGNKKDKTEELPIAQQLQLQQQMQQQQMQAALAQSLIQSRDSSSQLNAAKAMMLQLQAQQMAGAGSSGGIV